ncbi:unnamed protein product [Ilex paraguariensis]|uniref:Cellulose synthase-like protein H1 n=1 Tax=Ilex paraguariensis TaxID=185542 RepID=A0ABC8ST70_9AQUA
MKDLRDLHYMLGIEAKRTATVLHLSQSKYALNLLSRASMLEVKLGPTPATPNSKLSQHEVILENKEGLPNGLPHLVYISREKHPKQPHHFKAGAMNVLTRVSGVMTNAPFMLNVDCDMYANNPQMVLHAMCMLLGVKNEMDSGFVQYTQCFYDGLKDDPFGNQLVVSFELRGVGDESLQNTFGKSMKFFKSAAQTVSESHAKTQNPSCLSSSLEAAYQVASCCYEQGTSWGEKEILLSPKSPIFTTFNSELQFRQCLAYVGIQMSALQTIPEICYAALPAYCIITNSHFLPKVYEPTKLIIVAFFLIYNIYTLLESVRVGLSIQAWWNNQKMSRIISVTSWFFGFLSGTLKLLGLSETMFEVTKKNQTTGAHDTNASAGRFTFDESLIFVPGTTILLVNLTASC